MRVRKIIVYIANALICAPAVDNAINGSILYYEYPKENGIWA